ncbi:hypothetical protein [Elizabethkingia argenteiflava]|uniref:hypothetical protein n=1 Tax=Elizabethkingia argenteiflava TaxID=2681556 RepID=UPI001FCE6654|nr:hypothetical protein [Elizabethkingia argenteiflava]
MTSWEHINDQNKILGYYISMPTDSTTPMYIYPSYRKYYDLKMYIFDTSTGREIKNVSYNAQSYHSATTAVKIQKANYDLHIGSYFGGIWEDHFIF